MYIDPDMRELLDALSKCIVPRSRRKAVWHTNWHTPYYSPGRYKRVA
ncbi:MAG: hypothetical protein IJ588_01140 [Prevotella sp.]|nr:hypothetical protein [Prevotella sp.]